MRIAIVSINRPSLDSAIKLSSYLHEYELDIYGKESLEGVISYNGLDNILPSLWSKYEAIVFLIATGAVVRKIAPFLKDKSSDPAVLVVNLALNRVVPLIGGHLAGANSLSSIICSRIPNCINFISTATDQTNSLAFDMLAKARKWRIENIGKLANISNRLINGESVEVATYPNVFKTLPQRDNLKLRDLNNLDFKGVIISPIIKSLNSLVLIPKVYLGIGCNRNTPMEKIERAFELFLKKYALLPSDIGGIASFEAKKDEVGILDFSKKYGFVPSFFSKMELNSLQNDFSKSASTKFFGLQGVAEPSAVLLSEYRELIIKKEIYFKSVTIAGAI